MYKLFDNYRIWGYTGQAHANYVSTMGNALSVWPQLLQYVFSALNSLKYHRNDYRFRYFSNQ